MSPQYILCVRRDRLAARLNGIPNGFTTDQHLVTGLHDAAHQIGEFRPRPELEEDPTYLQIIVQGVVTRSTGEPLSARGERLLMVDVLALFRATREQRTDRFVETRHNAKVALSAGGHVERAEEHANDLLRAAQYRELLEELVFEPLPAPSALRPIGVVCRDATLFDRVHIGLVYHVPAPGSVRLPEGSNEFTAIEFVAGDRLRELQPRMEGWGQLIADAILTGRLVLT